MKILVASCLLGENVRYDGENLSLTASPKFSFSQKELFMDILCENEIYSFCPEVVGGLETPRPKAEITSIDKPFKIENVSGVDVTLNFLIGAKEALDICKEENILVALLKSKSPSCGNKQIYDGTFSGTLINGIGMTARLLLENGIKIFNENELKELAKFIKSNKSL